MKYEMFAGKTLYSPESERESLLVRTILGQMVSLVSSRRLLLWDNEKARHNCWYPASCLLPFPRPSDETPFVLVIDCALTTVFADDPFVETRWSQHMKDEVDVTDFLGILREKLEINANGIDASSLIKTVNRLFKARGR